MNISFKPLYFSAKPKDADEIQQTADQIVDKCGGTLSQNGVRVSINSVERSIWCLKSEAAGFQRTCSVSADQWEWGDNMHPKVKSGNEKTALRLWEQFWDYGEDATITE